MNQIKIGELIRNNPQRDAIHIAVIPVVAGEYLAPGDKVRLSNDKKTVRLSPTIFEDIGVIDPFLKDGVKRGEKCWLFMFPNTITSIRHDWTHPAFGDDGSEFSRQWLTQFAAKLEMTYDGLIDAANNYIDNGEYHCLPFDTPDLVYKSETTDEFWKHFYNVTGKTLPDDEQQMFFRCSC